LGVTDFTALDVETANPDFASICSIGLVHFKNNEVFKALTILVDPEDEFDPGNIAIHGITPQQVKGKPTMAQVFSVVGAALRDTALVHHSPFDRTALARAAAKYGTSGLPCTWLDSLQVARRAWPEHKGNGGFSLANLASCYGIQFRHHDAAEDARCAGLLVVKAMADTGVPFQDWIDELGYESTESDYVPRPIFRRPSWAAKHAQEGNPDGFLCGEVIVFTGQLHIPRSEAAGMAAMAGCTVADSVTKKTTILVVGDQDLRLTKGQEKSSKHRKCEQMVAGGQKIRILQETDFLALCS